MTTDKTPVVAWRCSVTGRHWALRKKKPLGWPFNDALVLATDYEAAIARAEAAERDAARYRWLRDSTPEQFDQFEPEIYSGGDSLDISLDAAIDAQKAGAA